MKRQVFGEEIRRLRNEKNISQHDLVEGICSQSMLSFIESGKYMPNVSILVQLCKRLELDTDRLLFHNHYEISSIEQLSKKCEKLCNNHLYYELFEFLNLKMVTDSIETSEQMQAYYYYLACCQYHIEKDSRKSYISFQLSIAEAGLKNNTLKCLSNACLGLLNAKLGKKESTKKYINQSKIDFRELNYEKNLTILFYLEAYSYFTLGMLEKACQTLEEGIEFVTEHDSHFMLGNMFYMAAKVAEKAEKNNIIRENQQNSEMFEKLFNEKVFKEIY